MFSNQTKQKCFIVFASQDLILPFPYFSFFIPWSSPSSRGNIHYCVVSPRWEAKLDDHKLEAFPYPISSMAFKNRPVLYEVLATINTQIKLNEPELKSLWNLFELVRFYIEPFLCLLNSEVKRASQNIHLKRNCNRKQNSVCSLAAEQLNPCDLMSGDVYSTFSLARLWD